MFRRRNSGAVADAVPAGLAERLYDWAVIRARSPSLYTECGVPDTIEGRFELLTLHIVVLLNRLRQENDGSARTSQALFDLYVSHLDGAMREMGVGDLAMGKRMRSLGEIFYGRAQAYEAAFAALPDRETLDALLSRTLLGASPGASAAPLTKYVEGLRAELADHAITDLAPNA
jgi:cytochrome b pre-mRNA-processing protein 3